MKPWAVRYKSVGQTPLEVVEHFRREENLAPDVPLAYAGRLDPMADGKLLILIGDECKVQEQYHHLDKAYRFQILLGFRSDTGDVLGLAESLPFSFTSEKKLSYMIRNILPQLVGTVAFPYPKFSSRPVQGKPLHVWTLEGRLAEIDIPTKTSVVYSLHIEKTETKTGAQIKKEIFEKINSIPEVTDPRKALGADFRRDAIRTRWNELLQGKESKSFFILTMLCEASSGTYMRTLAEEIAKKLNTYGLAYSITRTKLGKRFRHIPFWYKTFS